MSFEYPTQFSQTKIIVPSEELHEHGFYAQAGLRADDMAAITPIAQSRSVQEFCPKDADGRFGSIEQAKEWLAKGRGMFQLRQAGTDTLAGYGWTGPEQNPYIDGSKTTFAVRLSPEFAGQGLATPFTSAILLGSAALYGAKNVWLETWQSNQAAVRTYERNGAVQVAAVEEERPTLMDSSGWRPDARLFMRFAETFPDNQIMQEREG